MGNCCDRGSTSGAINESKKKKIRRKIQMIALGLEGAGKTHVVKLLCGEPPINLATSLGYSSHLISYDKAFDVELMDVGGRNSIRSIWYNYLAECHAIIYVIDVQNLDDPKIDESATLLKNLAVREDVTGKPIFLIINRPGNDFDEIAFVARMGLHEPPFNINQRFHIAQMLPYNGYLDKEKQPPPMFVVRQKKHTDQLLEAFTSFIDKVITEFVLLDVGVAEAKRRLEVRIAAEKQARAARAAQREREEQDRAAGIQETNVDAVDDQQPGVSNAAYVRTEDDEPLTQAPVAGRVVPVISHGEPGTSTDGGRYEIDLHDKSSISKPQDNERLSSDVFLPPSTRSTLPRPLPQLNVSNETGILGERSPLPEPAQAHESPPVAPVPKPRRFSNSDNQIIVVHPKSTTRLSRMERIQKGLELKSQNSKIIANGHVNQGFMREVV